MDTLNIADGEMAIKHVESLSKDELRQWIYNCLHGHNDILLVDLRDIDLPHYLIASIYSDLDREVRRDISKIVLAFVDDLERDSNPDWHGDAADELLLLAQLICEDDLVPYLQEMASQERPEIQYRVLQSLVALQWRGTIEFWHEQAKRNPNEYAGLAFDGLAIIDATPAIKLLTSLPWTDEVEDKILTALPSFINQYQASVVVPLFKQCFVRMSHRAEVAIRQFLAEEGITLEKHRHKVQASGRIIILKTKKKTKKAISTN